MYGGTVLSCSVDMRARVTVTPAPDLVLETNEQECRIATRDDLRPRGDHFDVARAILHGEPLISPGPEALASLEVANAMLLSGHTGRAVSIPVDRAAYDAFIAEKQASSKDKEVEDKRITDPNYVH